MGLVSIMPQVTAKTKQMPIQRKLQSYLGWQEWCSWILSMKKCDRNLNFVIARSRWKYCYIENFVYASFQSWSAVWLCSKFYLLYREGRNGYWSVEGISGAIILMCLMMVSSDARTLQCVLAVKAWLNVISVYQVLRESQIIANPELALADERLVLFRSLHAWFSFSSH